MSRGVRALAYMLSAAVMLGFLAMFGFGFASIWVADKELADNLADSAFLMFVVNVGLVLAAILAWAGALDAD